MTDDRQTSGKSGKMMKYAMLACCAVMIVPIAALLLLGGSLSGLNGNLFLLVPLALCVGAHFFLHRVTGKSCHSDTETDQGTVQDGELQQPVSAASVEPALVADRRVIKN